MSIPTTAPGRQTAFRFSALVAAAAAIGGFGSEAQAQVVTNGSFEVNSASFTTFPGYVSTGSNPTIAGWTSNNQRSGLNNDTGTGNPFANNGTKPDGPTVAFLQVGSQGSTSLSQVITGFTVGDVYNVEFFLNRRSSPFTPGLNLSVLIDATSIYSAEVPLSGGTNPYTFVTTDSFVATSTTATLTFLATNPNGGDSTALIDDVSINGFGTVAPEPGTLALLLPVAVGGLAVARRRK